MKLKDALLDPAAVPVRWLHGENTLRTYLAQRDQCLYLYFRARARRPLDLPEGGAPEISLGSRRHGPVPARTAERRPAPMHQPLER